MKIKKIIIFPLILIFFLAISLATDDGDTKKDKKNKSDSKSKIEKKLKTKSVTFSEAKNFMQNRCNDINQTLTNSKTTNFNGTKLYMFMSVAENGYVCISTISEHKLDVMASDCGRAELKISQWNELN